MKITEKKLNEIEDELIAKHFSGLRPRPVKIDNSLVEYARAAKPDMFFNARKHRSLREARDTIMHELIHYELADTGKYAGHGIDFKRRARKLGILGRIELDQCFSGEETLNRPHTMELKKIPREEFADQMDGHLEKLRHLAACTPLKLREKIYREAREIEAIWGGYRNAVQGGEDFVTEEIIKSRRGPRGKPLDVLIKEGRELRARRDTLQQKYSETKDQKVLKELQQVSRMLHPLREKLSRDYDIEF